MNRSNLINGLAVRDCEGTWVLFREADTLLKNRNQTIKVLKKRIYNLNRQLKRKQKERKIRIKKPFKGRAKFTIQISPGKFYSMSAKGLVKRLWV